MAETEGKLLTCDLVHDLQNADGWPDDDKLMDYGIDPKEVK